MNDKQYQKRLEHLERVRERTNAHLEAHKKRINERLDRQQEKLQRKLTHKQEEIINAGLKLLDEEGLESVTLRSVAKHLNMQAPAIYWHFKNKTNLLDFLAEAILQEEFPELQARTDEPWDEWLVVMMHRLRKAMLSYKDGARVVAGAHLYPAETLAKFMDVSMGSLVSAGLSIREADLIVSTLVHFAFGRVIEEQSGPTPEELAQHNVSEILRNFPYIEQSVTQTQKMSGFTATTDFDDSLKLIIGGYKPKTN
jgi:TetR/AcrR family tetracycline transcriptional repressor